MTDDKPAVPQAPVPEWDKIPAELAQRQQWVLWRFEWDEKRSAWLKVPYYVGGGRRSGDQGSDRDRQRLATLPVVRLQVARHRADRIAGAAKQVDTPIAFKVDRIALPARWHELRHAHGAGKRAAAGREASHRDQAQTDPRKY